LQIATCCESGFVNCQAGSMLTSKARWRRLATAAGFEVFEGVFNRGWLVVLAKPRE
jgi:hypothetical protein